MASDLYVPGRPAEHEQWPESEWSDPASAGGPDTSGRSVPPTRQTTSPLPNSPERSTTPVRPRRWRRTRHVLGSTTTLALAVYALARLEGLLILRWDAHQNKVDLTTVLEKWDGSILLTIARSGYRWDVSKSNPASPAFFPGFPMLVRMFGGLGFHPLAAGVAISLVSGAMATAGVVRLAGLLPRFDRRLVLSMSMLVSVLPLSVVFLIPYTDALFLAISTWSLYYVLSGRWVWGGLLAAVAGLVRPVGIALALAVAAQFLVSCVRARRLRVRPLIGALLAPLGAAGYLAWCAMKLHSATAYLRVQQVGWGAKFDGGQGLLVYLRHAFASGGQLHDVVVAFAVVGSAGLLLTLVVQRLPTLLTVYSAAVLVESYLSGGVINSKLRIILPAVALLIPLAALFRGFSRAQFVSVTAVLMTVGAWYGAYVMVSYSYAI